MWSEFSTRVPGKWVLAGEHSVLRGATAIALPHPEFGLKLSFKPGGELNILPREADAVIREVLDSIDDYRGDQGYSFERPRGTLSIESTIPIGAGLGSSAALCVALTRWLAEPLRIAPDQQLEFATQLEHRFHGRSSGMDVAAISSGEPVSFIMNRGSTRLGVRKLPRFTFHDTGLRARTIECVVRVEKFREENATLAYQIDEQMGAASRLGMEGLIAYDAGDKDRARELLAKSMRQAQECYYSWQLIPGEGRRLEHELELKGALATKLTGAGGGGMIVALWPDS